MLFVYRSAKQAFRYITLNIDRLGEIIIVIAEGCHIDSMYSLLSGFAAKIYLKYCAYSSCAYYVKLLLLDWSVFKLRLSDSAL